MAPCAAWTSRTSAPLGPASFHLPAPWCSELTRSVVRARFSSTRATTSPIAPPITRQLASLPTVTSRSLGRRCSARSARPSSVGRVRRTQPWTPGGYVTPGAHLVLEHRADASTAKQSASAAAAVGAGSSLSLAAGVRRGACIADSRQGNDRACRAGFRSAVHRLAYDNSGPRSRRSMAAGHDRPNRPSIRPPRSSP